MRLDVFLDFFSRITVDFCRDQSLASSFPYIWLFPISGGVIISPKEKNTVARRPFDPKRSQSADCELRSGRESHLSKTFAVRPAAPRRRRDRLYLTPTAAAVRPRLSPSRSNIPLPVLSLSLSPSHSLQQHDLAMLLRFRTSASSPRVGPERNAIFLCF